MNMERNIIIQGDCLQILNKMEDNSVDMVFTSPPFKDEDVDGNYWEIYEKWHKEIIRVAGKVAIIIHSATKLNELIARFPPKRLMIWGKGISQYSYRFNPILVYQKSDNYKVNKYIWCDCFGVQAVTGKWKVHKYQDPPLLYETIIKMFKGCTSILDPFIGSGTTAEVANKLGMNWAGIELNPDCIKLAEKRINSVNPPLFTEA